MVLRLRQGNRSRHKLSLPWEGPYIIAEVLKPARTSWRMKMAKSSLMLGTYNSYIASILRVPSYSYIVRTRFTYLFFGNLLDPRGLGCTRTLRYAWLYPWQSQASLGATTGGTPERPQKSPTFFRKKTSVSKLLVHLEKMDARHKHYSTGPAESWGHLRLRDTAPPSPPHA